LSVGEATFPEREPIPACPAGSGSKEEEAEALLEDTSLARALTAPGESGSTSIAEEAVPRMPEAPCAIAAGTPPANKMSARN